MSYENRFTRRGLTFDDVLIVPAYSEVMPSEVDTSTDLTTGIRLANPIISAAMDTVTEAIMAMAMSKAGGIGIIHKNMSPEDQACQVRVTKYNDRLGAMCGAAIGTGDDSFRRAELLIGAGVDVLVIDTAHGHSLNVIKMVERVKKAWPDMQVIAGNVATQVGTRDLINAGANAVKVGIGPGTICTTRLVAGVGVPQLTAIFECSHEAMQHCVPIIADGGIRTSGDIVKALAAGASSVMLGSLLAGSDESPGDVVTIDGARYKAYRGMGSVDAMKLGSKDRYAQAGVTDSRKLVPEGVSGYRPYTGPVADTLHQIVGGIRSGMGYTGSPYIRALLGTEFTEITTAGVHESRVHDLFQGDK